MILLFFIILFISFSLLCLSVYLSSFLILCLYVFICIFKPLFVSEIIIELYYIEMLIK